MEASSYAVIDYAALRHNLSIVGHYAPSSKIMAVIKANAYGHGLLGVANALNHADGFAVARIDEAIKLRQQGHQQRILVLAGFSNATELKCFYQYQLDSVIHHSHQLDLLERQNQPPLNVWLKLDSGMGRLGFRPDEFEAAYQRLKACAVNDIILMTHLANADDLKDNKTQQQLKVFKQHSHQQVSSIANSAAILAWQQAISEWVRPGIMLYGISPFADKTSKDFGLRPVMQLHSKLIAIKTLQKGDSVGYGTDYQCQQTTRLGIVAIGYGDGYPRSAKTGTPVLIHQQRVPLIGRVSMDIITVDLNTCPAAQIGDTVTLWGNDLAIEIIANHANTIPYTLVCGITQRVPILVRQLATT